MLLSLVELYKLTSDQQLPIGLFEKYPTIRTVRLYGLISNSTRFMNFLNGCRNLSELDLNGTILDKRIYDELPVSLTKLKLIEHGEAKLDLSFLRRLEHLHTLTTNQSASVDLVLDLMIGLRHFVSFEFKTKKSIKKICKNLYYFVWYQNGIRSSRNVSCNELVGLWNEMELNVL